MTYKLPPEHRDLPEIELEYHRNGDELGLYLVRELADLRDQYEGELECRFQAEDKLEEFAGFIYGHLEDLIDMIDGCENLSIAEHQPIEKLIVHMQNKCDENRDE